MGKTYKNIFQLYFFSFIKIVLPLVILPYLMRSLSVETYGVVIYVKSIIGYFQLFVDFGFVVSGTADIVEANGDKGRISTVSGNVLTAKLLLSGGAFAALLVIQELIPMLTHYKLFTVLSFVPVFMSIFLMDFVFRGMEHMEVLTERYAIMKGFSTVVTLIFVKSDANILLIPLFDIIGSAAAVIFVWLRLKDYGVLPTRGTLKNALSQLQKSSVYFISDIASMTFTSFLTVVIGLYLSERDVAYWGSCMQIVTAIGLMYVPVVDGLFPEMKKTRDFSLFKETLIKFLILFTLGCGVIFVFAKFTLLVIGGEKYVGAYTILRLMMPIAWGGFLSLMLGWPALGVIGKQNWVTVTTVIASVIQVILVVILLLTGHFSIPTVAVSRYITELFIIVSRSIVLFRNKPHMAQN